MKYIGFYGEIEEINYDRMDEEGTSPGQDFCVITADNLDEAKRKYFEYWWGKTTDHERIGCAYRAVVMEAMDYDLNDLIEEYGETDAKLIMYIGSTYPTACNLNPYDIPAKYRTLSKDVMYQLSKKYCTYSLFYLVEVAAEL